MLIFRICLDIAHGMCYLHRRHIVHKDLKPDNIMLMSLDPSAEVVAKLTDFGTSKVRHRCVCISMYSVVLVAWGR